MRAFVQGSLLVMVVLISGACAGPVQNNAEPAQDDAAEAEAIEAVNQALSDCVAAKDAETCSGLYTVEAIYMAPNADPVEGRAAIAEAFAAEIAAGMEVVRLTADEIEVFGTTAHEVGHFVIESGDGTHLDHGKYIVLWKRTEEGWKLHRDIFNSNMAAS